MATARVRHVDLGIDRGIYSNKDAIPSSTFEDRQRGFERIEDVTYGFDTDNPLFISRDRKRGGHLNGSASAKITWTEVPVNINLAGTTLQFMESEDNATRRGFNITNPGRADILLPNFIAELRDIPRMIRQAGDTYRWLHNGLRRPPNTIASSLPLAKKIAADNLAVQFGWQPLVSDLYKIVTFQAALLARQKEFRRLYRGKGLRRRQTLDKREVIQKSANGHAIWSRHAVILDVRNVQRRSFVHRWLTIRYKPTADTPLISDEMSLRMMLMGVTPNNIAQNLWETIPWTWLVDYFSNLGDIVHATNNAAHIRVSEVNLMSHAGVEITSPEQTVRSVGRFGVQLSKFERVVETKARKVGMPSFPIPEMSLPILGGKQLSILGSLAVMRVGK